MTFRNFISLSITLRFLQEPLQGPRWVYRAGLLLVDHRKEGLVINVTRSYAIILNSGRHKSQYIIVIVFRGHIRLCTFPTLICVMVPPSVSVGNLSAL